MATSDTFLAARPQSTSAIGTTRKRSLESLCLKRDSFSFHTFSLIKHLSSFLSELESLISRVEYERDSVSPLLLLPVTVFSV